MNEQSGRYTVGDALWSLNRISGGRMVMDKAQISMTSNPFVVIKSSNIPGKSLMEYPGIVYGDPKSPIKKIGVAMTLTESVIELAGATGIELLVCHHPVADAASSGGVPLRFYLGLYNIAVIEMHEAFHGLHPGIPYLHGHKVVHSNITYGGLPGNIMFVGEAFPEVNTLGDILNRLALFMARNQEEKMLAEEKNVRECTDILETNIAASARILVGQADSLVRKVLHIFPHTGFSVAHLEQAVQEFPGIDTVLASISRTPAAGALVTKAGELGLNFVLGNSHALEIFENGLPLATALQSMLPGVEVVILRERVTSTPLAQTGNDAIRQYAREMADKHLLARALEPNN